eukprot:CAMPEP_0179182114 /NCGR_PEP_ID=MMETSP0796-20121207/90224_1 /TAXON_ID=73915 /ORGANISM="Pyrodinium bahamense, Strain pbaha01" /LENGTH=49 /DNA_ID=CAMNT_0020885937 /DNA_START=76 /DNA_END=225 /DNA_ORIENTATION=+
MQLCKCREESRVQLSPRGGAPPMVQKHSQLCSLAEKGGTAKPADARGPQ